MKTVELTKADVFDLLDADDSIKIDTGSWRHGRRETWVAKKDGQLIKFTVEIHHEEGVQVYGGLTATVVRAVEKVVTTTDYVPVE